MVSDEGATDVIKEQWMAGGWLWRGGAGLVVVSLAGAILAGSGQAQLSPTFDQAAPNAAPATQTTLESDVFGALGSFSGAHLYATYISIGSVADCYVNGNYKAEKVQGLMTSFEKISIALKTRLELIESKLVTPQDKKATREIIEALSLLQQEAQQLSEFTRTNSDQDFRLYEQTRTTVWPKIQAILGLQ